MKVAMLYAGWEDFGEPWCTPLGIRHELENRKHEVRHYNLYHDKGRLFNNNMRRYSNQCINSLYTDFNNKSFIPDIILCMDYGPWDALAFDKKYFPGVLLVKEAGDEPQSHHLHFQAASRVHVILSPDRRCVERYRQFGHNAVHWTHHADTSIFYPREHIQEVFDCVSTCGPRGGNLTKDISKKLKNSFNNERYFFGNDHAERLCMGKIVFQCSQYKEITRRIFEGMACGKMVITDRLPEHTGLSDLFVENEDIVYYDDARDAIEKIKFYASHDEERLRIARNGFNKTIAEHTMVQRVDVLEKLLKESIV